MNAAPGSARRRTAGFGAVAVAGVLLTSACGAGQVAQTQNQRPSVTGVNAQVGAIAIRNLTVEEPQGNSYPKGSDLRLIGVFVNNGTSTDLLTSVSSASFSSWGSYRTIVEGDQVVAAASSSAAGSATPPIVQAPSSGTPTPSTTASPSGSASGSGSASESASPTEAPSSSTAPQASRSVPIPAHGRTSYGVPDATGSLLALNTTSTIYPGTIVTMTLTFARAGTVTVSVPVNITSDPSQSVLPASGASSG